MTAAILATPQLTPQVHGRQDTVRHTSRADLTASVGHPLLARANAETRTKSADRLTSSPKPAIALLITADVSDVADLKHNLGGLGRAFPSSAAPILMFHEGDVDQGLQDELASVLANGGYHGDARFHEVHFDLPRNCCSFQPNWSKRKDRGKFAYQNMIRFWIRDVWLHSALDEFDTVMRLDSDSFIGEPQPAGDPLPALQDGVVYRGNVLQHDPPEVSQHFGEFIAHTLDKWPHAPNNPEIISNFTTSLRATNSVPIIYNNFFVARVEFFRRARVRQLVDAMCCTWPDFYVYRYRWGDAFLHYFLLGMEAHPSEFVISPPVGYMHSGVLM